MTIEERAEQLANEILEKYYSQISWSDKALMTMVDEEMLSYNEDIGREVGTAIGAILSKSFTKSIPTVIPTPIQLSNMLYKNGKKVAAETYQVLKAAQKAKITAKELAMQLYDGYRFKDERVIDVVEKLPKYAQRYINKPSVQKDFISQIKKLKTKPYRTAMNLLDEAVQSKSEEAIEKALYVVTEERARFYGERIAATEVQRAKTLTDADDMLLDDDIELMKFRMSSLHKIYDECDAFAKADSFGYGAGVYPKNKFPSLPLHPFCRCVAEPVYSTPKRKQSGYGMRKYIDSVSIDKQRQILGSFDKVKEFKRGKSPISIWNNNRKDKYKIVPVKDVLESTRKFNKIT